MPNKRIGIIGCGNMGGALVKGIIKSGEVDAESILVLDEEHKKAETLSKKYGVIARARLNDVLRFADYVILAVKPSIVPEVLKKMKKDELRDTVIISIAAGVTIESIEKVLECECKVARVMPNTPALIKESMSAICYNKNINDKEMTSIKKIFEYIGRVIEVNENQMNAVTALSGSGPAYVFMFIEAMADAGVRMGLKRDIAYELSAQTVLGSAKMVMETGKHPGELKDMVCSPAGTTIEAVYQLEKRGFRGTVMKAIGEAFEKAEEMSEED
ncbi:MAG: pyrroline-5-carboxylate reductase [Ignavibacteriales bacterium]